RRSTFLIDDVPIIYAPSLATFQLLGHERPRERIAPARLLAVGDPAYSPADPGRSVREELITRSGMRLYPIPHTKTEVERIASLFGERNRRVLLGQQATIDEVRASRVRSYDYVHFAVHGLIPDDLKSLVEPTLLLANSRASRDGNGFLGLGDLAGLGIRAHMTTLSACNTGVGPLLRSEGSLAFSTALLASGSDHVL